MNQRLNRTLKYAGIGALTGILYTVWTEWPLDQYSGPQVAGLFGAFIGGAAGFGIPSAVAGYFNIFGNFLGKQ